MVQGSVQDDWGPKPFRLYNMWFSSPDFKELLKTEWRALSHLQLQKKFRALKRPIKQWSKKRFSDLDSRIERLIKEQEKLQLIGEGRNLFEVELLRLRALYSQIKQLSNKKE